MRGYLSAFSRRQFYSVGVAVAAVVATLGWYGLPSSANPTGPQRSDYGVTKAVQGLTERDHLSRHPLDDEISRRTMKAFLSSFDPRKMYFLKSDIDQFMQKETQLDDEVKKGRVDFAYEVYTRFRQRLDERVKLIEELVKEPIDFTVDEELVTDAKQLDYPRDEAEARDRWRKLVKYSVLIARADKEDEQVAREKILKRYRRTALNWQQTNSDDLLEQFLTSLTESFDPHTSYMSPSTLDTFRIQMRLNLEGIGAALQPDDEGLTKVSKIIPGGAADKHGQQHPDEQLKPDDRIVSVGQGEAGEMVDVQEMRLNDVVKLIRGHAGTVVRLGVRPATGGETKIYSIVREKVELEDSAARSVVLDRGQKSDGSPFKIGVIDLPSFYVDMEAARDGGNNGYRSTTRDVSRILDEFNAQGVDLVVLDLRFNGGGSLPEAESLTGLFVSQGPIVQVKDSYGRIEVKRDPDPRMMWKGPLIVLTSKFSASASEILAGAIQDYRRGLVIGDTSTHGKGTVQNLLDVGETIFHVPDPPNYGALKLTTHQFYRPSGDSTQKRGVLADLVLPSLLSLMGSGEAELDYAIEFDRVKPAKFDPYNMVPPDALSRLRAQSEARLQSSEDFAKLKRDIERYQRYKDEKSIPLNEEKFLARRVAERDAEKEEEKQIEAQNGNKDEVFKDDFYGQEIVAIAVDYLNELSRRDYARVGVLPSSN